MVTTTPLSFNFKHVHYEVETVNMRFTVCMRCGVCKKGRILFKCCIEDFLKAEIFPSLAGRGGKLSGVSAVMLMYSFTLSPLLCSLDHERGEEGDLS